MVVFTSSNQPILSMKIIRVIARIVVIMLVVLIGVIYYFSKQTPPKQADSTVIEQSKSVGYGETGIIRTGMAAGVSEDDYDAVMKAASTKDRTGIDALIDSKRAVMVDNGTKVKVIGSGFNKRQVRLLDGDSQGAAVWVPVEYVSPE